MATSAPGAPARQTAFLHIGLPKTGTTYLQSVLWRNKPLLAQRGILLPGRRHRAHMLATLEIRGHPDMANRTRSRRPPWQLLVEKANNWDGDLVVSHEFFGAAAPDQIRRMVTDLERYDVRVIITARAMAALGVSRWQEYVKNGGRKHIDGYPASEEYVPWQAWGWGTFDLADILDRWSLVVAPEHIHVLITSPGRPREELWHRFAAVLGIDPSGFDLGATTRNASLGVVEVELLHRINHKLEGFTSPSNRGNWIRRYLAEGDILPRRRERFRPGEDKLADLAKRAREAADRLREGGFVVDGDPAEVEADLPQGLRHPHEVTDAELLDSATTAIANLMRDVRALTEERDALLEAADAAQIPGQDVGEPAPRLRDRWRRRG